MCPGDDHTPMAKEHVVSNGDSAGHRIEQRVLQVRARSHAKPICGAEDLRSTILNALRIRRTKITPKPMPEGANACNHPVPSPASEPGTVRGSFEQRNEYILPGRGRRMRHQASADAPGSRDTPLPKEPKRFSNRRAG